MTIDHEDLIAGTRERVRTGRNPGGRQVYTKGDEERMSALADALESTTTRLREAEREMHARELHHFEEEKLRVDAEGRAERYQGLARRTELQCQDAEARLREAEACIGEIRANAVELLDADDDSHDGSLSATWVVERLSRVQAHRGER